MGLFDNNNGNNRYDPTMAMTKAASGILPGKKTNSIIPGRKAWSPLSKRGITSQMSFLPGARPMGGALAGNAYSGRPNISNPAIPSFAKPLPVAPDPIAPIAPKPAPVAPTPIAPIIPPVTTDKGYGNTGISFDGSGNPIVAPVTTDKGYGNTGIQLPTSAPDAPLTPIAPKPAVQDGYLGAQSKYNELNNLSTQFKSGWASGSRLQGTKAQVDLLLQDPSVIDTPLYSQLLSLQNTLRLAQVATRGGSAR